MRVKPGSLVKYREREWIVLPSEEKDIIYLRPLGGSAREVTGIYMPLAELVASSLPYERVEPAKFPLPKPESAQDKTAVHLLQQSARLLLRQGATPLRSLGNLSFRPRPYQFVPLLMALRLNVVRILIADDVGVGKTIEGAMIARELLDRGEVQKFAVICPPYLCDQWQRELKEKFNIDAVVIRSGTVSRLEKRIPPDNSIFEYYPYLIASIDLIKQPHYKSQFLVHCPNLIIVDEAHGATKPPNSDRRRAQQQRYELIKELSQNNQRHLILLTATPHSGIGESFLSLLGHLNPDFENLDLSSPQEAEISQLARHFVQRRRADVRRWMGEETPFPERENHEAAYNFSREYRKFYQDIYNFAYGLVRDAETLKGWRQRMRFWSALALLRCVTSSPAAASATLEKRLSEQEDAGLSSQDIASAAVDELEEEFEPVIYDPMDTEATTDTQPGNVIKAQELDPDLDASTRRRLRAFARQAAKLKGKPDHKLSKLCEVLEELLDEGYHPIVWCRYIATSDYVAEALQERLCRRYKDIRVLSITGMLSEQERQIKLKELENCQRRVLVATDCLSEGINLQERFNAVVHYDLPWNPNRLEQREGRVDRFGQTSTKVKAVLLYGTDNPVDAAVLDVLLRKAREIHRDLKVRVPVPMDSTTIMDTILRSLFMRSRLEGPQLKLFEDPQLDRFTREVHERWVKAAYSEKESRTRFAQRAIKPDEVQKELDRSDAVLGNPEDVLRFITDASQRLGFGFRKVEDRVWEIEKISLPEPVKATLKDSPEKMRITFYSPTPEGVEYVGRNHPLVESLAEHLMDRAFHPLSGNEPASRCGVVRTADVKRRTTLFLLRLRYLLHERGDETPSLAEEIICSGFQGIPPKITLIQPEEAQRLLDTAAASGNVSTDEKREVLTETLSWWHDFKRDLKDILKQRAGAVQEANSRLRGIINRKTVQVEPLYPPDLIGIVVLIPIPGGGQK